MKSRKISARTFANPDQRENEREATERRERHRISRIAADESWLNPRNWLSNSDGPQERPKEVGEEWSGYFEFLKSSDGKDKRKGKETGSAEGKEDGGEEQARGKQEDGG